MAQARQQSRAPAGRIRQAVRYRLTRLWYTKCWVAFYRDVLQYRSPTESQADVVFRRVGAEELDSLANLAEYMGPSARTILAEQFVCLDDITLIGTSAETGRLVYHTWLSYGCMGLKLLGDWALRPAATLRRAWVAPALRGKGIATVGCGLIMQAAAENGARQIWSFVLPGNAPSLRIHEKLGFRQAGDVCLKARFGRKHLIARCDDRQGRRRTEVPADFHTL